MTALNCFVTSEAVHIATDGAGYLTDGTPSGQGQKVAILAHLPCVVAVRGATAFVHMLGASISASFGSFDAFLPEAPELLHGVRRQYRQEMGARGLTEIAPRDAEFVVAGYSAVRSRVEAYAINNRGWSGGRAWEAVPITEAMLAPLDATIAKGVDTLIAQVGDLRRLPEIAAVRIMEIQRSQPLTLENGQSAVCIGGFCQLTTIRRDGIESRILRRWPSS